MGCEPSHLTHETSAVIRVESISTEEDIELKAESIISRHRGDPH